MGKISPRERRRRRFRRRMLRTIFFECCILLLLCFGCMLVNSGNVYKKVILEAGNSLTIEKFVRKHAEKASFTTDISQIQTNGPGDYTVGISYDGKDYETKLEIVDTIRPTAEPVVKTVYNGAAVDPMSLVDHVTDNTLVKAEFKKDYDFKEIGTYDVTIILTDLGDNKTEIETKVTSVIDEEAPMIIGTKDIEIGMGDTIAYKKDVTVTDNLDTNVELVIDNNAVDNKVPGQYPVTYTARDEAGNETTVSITVTVREPEKGEYNEDIVYYLAKGILKEITNDSMSITQKAKAVYTWCRNNIAYTSTSDKSDWVQGAYQAFTDKKGDCFNYFAAGKAMLNVLGIDNVDVIKSDTSHSSHYWSLIDLGSGYYHYDCTPRKGGGEFFMLTDAQLEAYSKKHNNSHIFDKDAYPARQTEKFNLK